MALVIYRGSRDFMTDMIRKGGYEHFTYSVLSRQRSRTFGGTLSRQPSWLCHTLSHPEGNTYFNEIVHYLATELSLPISTVMSVYKRCPRKQLLRLEDVKLTLALLKESGFETNVIAESVIICFYNCNYIKRGFQQITENEIGLSERGFINGHTKDVTNKFIKGTVSKDKRLQLCLYYMELPFNFNGFGCFVKT